MQSILEDVLYTCGTTFDDLEIPGRLTNVFVKDHSCEDNIVKLYYSCSFEPICVHCASEEVTDAVDSDFLPQCQVCGSTIVDGPDLLETQNRHTNIVRDRTNRETM